MGHEVLPEGSKLDGLSPAFLVRFEVHCSGHHERPVQTQVSAGPIHYLGGRLGLHLRQVGHRDGRWRGARSGGGCRRWGRGGRARSCRGRGSVLGQGSSGRFRGTAGGGRPSRRGRRRLSSPRRCRFGMRRGRGCRGTGCRGGGRLGGGRLGGGRLGGGRRYRSGSGRNRRAVQTGFQLPDPLGQRF